MWVPETQSAVSNRHPHAPEVSSARPNSVSGTHRFPRVDAEGAAAVGLAFGAKEERTVELLAMEAVGEEDDAH